VERKARQLELFRPCHDVEPGQHSDRLLDMLRVHATPVVLLVEEFQTTMLKVADHLVIICSDNCQLSRSGLPESRFRRERDQEAVSVAVDAVLHCALPPPYLPGLDRLDYVVTSAGLWASEWICGPEPLTPADRQRERDHYRLRTAFPKVDIDGQCRS
jgi:hypothetical protein